MEQLTLIGFGEAAQTFATAAGWKGNASAFDLKTLDPAQRERKLTEYRVAGVRPCADATEASRASRTHISLVTADQALVAADEAATAMAARTLYLDMNSVSPGTKRRAADTVERCGGRYVDVAVMAPVLPARMAVPLLVSGPHARAGADALADAGFANVEIVGERIGEASSIKMVRSVLVKGIEAVTAECLLAAQAAGITDSVLKSLGSEWTGRGDYNFDRMLAHGLRRAAEMDEVARTLEELGVEPLMSRGTITRQRELGALGITPPAGLAAKLAAIEFHQREKAA